MKQQHYDYLLMKENNLEKEIAYLSWERAYTEDPEARFKLMLQIKKLLDERDEVGHEIGQAIINKHTDETDELDYEQVILTPKEFWKKEKKAAVTEDGQKQLHERMVAYAALVKANHNAKDEWPDLKKQGVEFTGDPFEEIGEIFSNEIIDVIIDNLLDGKEVVSFTDAFARYFDEGLIETAEYQLDDMVEEITYDVQCGDTEGIDPRLVAMAKQKIEEDPESYAMPEPTEEEKRAEKVREILNKAKEPFGKDFDIDKVSMNKAAQYFPSTMKQMQLSAEALNAGLKNPYRPSGEPVSAELSEEEEKEEELIRRIVSRFDPAEHPELNDFNGIYTPEPIGEDIPSATISKEDKIQLAGQVYAYCDLAFWYCWKGCRKPKKLIDDYINIFGGMAADVSELIALWV